MNTNSKPQLVYMRKMVTICLLSVSLAALAQEEPAKPNLGKKVVEKAKSTGENRTEQTTDKVVNKAGDKVDKAIDDLLDGKLFKKKKKKPTEEEAAAAKKKNSETAESTDTPAEVAEKPTTTPAPTAASGKFDFVPGDKQLFFDNFDRLAVGDFPAEINTNASGEIVTLNNKPGKWLRMSKNGAFVPDYTQKLPDNCTIEFEVGINGDPSNNYSGFGLNFSTLADELIKDMFFSKGTSILYLHPGASEASIAILPTNGTEINNSVAMPQWSVKNGTTFVKLSLWRQKGRLRLYLNEEKLLDVPRFFSENTTYSFAFFRSFFNECDVYLTNFRYAVAGADTRNKLLTEGKFTTNEILFDTNSDKIKPESNNIISEIGKLLTENAGVNIKIIGHTDNDGDAAANMVLSKKRAEAVKMRLAYGFGIEETRIQTDGKGASMPLNANKTAEEKAINRRVEFIKL
jgi:OmpA-OmpF porin, OOP family